MAHGHSRIGRFQLQFRSGLVARVLVLLSTVSSCHVSENAARPITEAIVTKSLDSCNAIPWPAARGAAVGAVAAHSKARWSGAVRTFRMFSLFIPDSARIVAPDSGTGGVTLAWPGCSGCRFGVAIQVDSGLGLDAHIARMLASQRAIDSINRDPQTVVHEFDEMDGPPKSFMTPNGRGYLINNACGDCAATTLLFGHPGYIAGVELGGDDDVPDLGRHLCEMTVVGKTFAWR
jgi:hypothetical protein